MNSTELISRIGGSAAVGDPTVPAPPLKVDGEALGEKVQFLTDELHALRRDHAKLQQAIFETAQIQRRLCAPRELDWGEFEISGEIFPVRHLSGDFFKVLELPLALGLVIGDIAGKGLTAGIWQAHMMGLVKRAAQKYVDPAAVMAEVNAEMCLDEDERPIMALFYARLDQKNRLVYCNAGLPGPLLLRVNQSVERLEEGGPMLGAMKNATFRVDIVTFNPGDMLVAYSDGVTECRNAQDDEFEIERLTNAAKAASRRSASAALFSLLATVLDFADSCSPGDDVTLLVVRRRYATHTEPSGARIKEFPAPQRRMFSAKKPKHPSRGGRSAK